MIRNREQLLTLFEKHAPHRHIRRAIEHGARIENLGGFDPLYPSKFPGWLVRVKSPFSDMVWLLALVVRPRDRRLMCFLQDIVPWADWVGDTATNPAYKGDNPEQYKEKKDEYLDTNGFDPGI